MRREDFTLDVSNVDWAETEGEPAKPVVSIDVTGSTEMIRERLTDAEGEVLAAEETDASFRLREPIDEESAGVVSVTNRVTGEFILELNAPADGVLQFVDAARGYGETATAGEGRYEVAITIDGEPFVTYDKRTFLVYDETGNLLRQHSLIPSGVEL
ncbi:DUF5793 family protein [Halobacteria archaeon AArc-dxtr1]|nr:DUF5793 family protein [Halobacteria archaeon AArc-dxtr1]